MEINYKLNLDVDQLNTLDNHSVLNIFNIVVLELMLLSDEFQDSSEMDPLIDILKARAELIVAGEFNIAYLNGLGELKMDILSGLHRLAAHQNLLDTPVYEKTFFNLKGIFDILELRTRELLERKTDPLSWIELKTSDVTGSLVQFLDAIARNSKGRYGIVYEMDQKSDLDYLVTIRVESHTGETIKMPAVFQDVIRDLSANARKYSSVGSIITIQIRQTQTELLFEVIDSGIGIHYGDIPSILGFGFRGRNALNKPTMGGGFGLTKAYYVAQLFRGRMWIDSSTEMPSGTKIRIQLPVECL